MAELDHVDIHGHKCSVAETGVCALHGEELQRRKGDRDRVTDLKEDIVKIEKDIRSLERAEGRASNFRSQLLVVGVIAMGIWGGSFWYTYEHKQEGATIARNLEDKIENEHEIHTDEMNRLHRVINALEKRVSSQDGRVLVIEDRYLRLLADLDRNSKQMDEIIKTLKE